jgi:hypothetical protein
MLPILTAVFNLKSQMLGGSSSGLVREEILDLIIKMNPSDEPSLSRPVDDVDDSGDYPWRRPENYVELDEDEVDLGGSSCKK